MAFGSSVLTHKKEQQIKIAGEFKPTVDCLCATRRGFVAVYIEKVRSAECTWDEPDAIDFNSLPDQFVLKCNHNSGRGMCICTNKKELDVEKLDQWMSVWYGVQWNRVLGIAKSIMQMPCEVQIIFSSRIPD